MKSFMQSKFTAVALLLNFGFCTSELRSYKQETTDLESHRVHYSSNVSINNKSCTVKKIYNSFQSTQAQEQAVTEYLNPIIDSYVAHNNPNQADHHFVIEVSDAGDLQELNHITIINYGSNPPAELPQDKSSLDHQRKDKQSDLYTSINGKPFSISLIGFTDPIKDEQKYTDLTRLQEPQKTTQQPKINDTPDLSDTPNQPLDILNTQKNNPPQRQSPEEMRESLEQMHSSTVSFADNQSQKLRKELAQRYYKDQENFIVATLHESALVHETQEATRKRLRHMSHTKRDELHQKLFTAKYAHELGLDRQPELTAAEKSLQQKKAAIESRFNGFAQLCKAHGYSEGAALDAARFNELYIKHTASSKNIITQDQYFSSLHVTDKCAWIEHLPEEFLETMTKEDFKNVYGRATQLYPSEIYNNHMLYRAPGFREFIAETPHFVDNIYAKIPQLEDSTLQEELFKNNPKARDEFRTWIDQKVKSLINAKTAAATQEIDSTARTFIERKTERATTKIDAIKPLAQSNHSKLDAKAFEQADMALDFDEMLAAFANDDIMRAFAEEDFFLNPAKLSRKAHATFGKSIDKFNNSTTNFIGNQIIKTINQASDIVERLSTAQKINAHADFPYQEMKTCVTESIVTHPRSIVNRAAELNEKGKPKAAHNLLKAGNALQSIINTALDVPGRYLAAFGKGIAQRPVVYAQTLQGLCTGVAKMMSDCITQASTAGRMAALYALNSFIPSADDAIYKKYADELKTYAASFKQRATEVIDSIASFAANSKALRTQTDQQLGDLGAFFAASSITQLSTHKRSMGDILSKEQLTRAEQIGTEFIKTISNVDGESICEWAGGTLVDSLALSGAFRVGGSLIQSIRNAQKIAALETAAKSVCPQSVVTLSGKTFVCDMPVSVQMNKLATTLQSSRLPSGVQQEISQSCLTQFHRQRTPFNTTLTKLLTEAEKTPPTIEGFGNLNPLSLRAHYNTTQQIRKLEEIKKITDKPKN
jgi:hypothetical protein